MRLPQSSTSDKSNELAKAALPNISEIGLSLAIQRVMNIRVREAAKDAEARIAHEAGETDKANRLYREAWTLEESARTAELVLKDLGIIVNTELDGNN